jgi:hypothetical protein
MFAMDVNDDEGCVNARVVGTFFVGAPPGACSLLQGRMPPIPRKNSGSTDRA